MEKQSVYFLQRIVIHFNGCGYYYATEGGQQLCKVYKTLTMLRKFGRVNFGV